MRRVLLIAAPIAALLLLPSAAQAFPKCTSSVIPAGIAVQQVGPIKVGSFSLSIRAKSLEVGLRGRIAQAADSQFAYSITHGCGPTAPQLNPQMCTSTTTST